MDEITKILDDKLKNNEVSLVKTILSYLEYCDLCKKYEDIYFRHYTNKTKCCGKCYDKWMLHP